MVTKHFYNDNFEDLYLSILSEIDLNPEFVTETRGISCKEITDLSFELTNPTNRFVFNKARNVNYEFAMKFFIWMLNGSSDFSYVASANPHAKEFIGKKSEDENTTPPANFSTAYGPRIVRQLPYILDEFKRDKGTRRAVIHVLHEDDLLMLGTDTKEEYPCTDNFTFLIRDNKLHMYSRMRSNNMVLTICYDVFNMTLLHEYLWKTLRNTYPDLQLGSYHHSIVSAHFFDKEQGLVDNVLSCSDYGISMR